MLIDFIKNNNLNQIEAEVKVDRFMRSEGVILPLEESYKMYKEKIENMLLGKDEDVLDFFDVLNIKEEPEIDFVVKGIERGTIGFLVGAGGAGKGFWINHLLFSSVGLTAKHNYERNFMLNGIKKMPKIGYFSFEDNKTQWTKRVHKSKKHYLCEEGSKEYIKQMEEVKELNNNFHFIDMTEQGAIFKNDVDMFGNVEENKAKTKISENIKKLGLDLIIIDTLSVINQKYDENSNQQMSAAMEELKDLARKNNVAILVVHHETKASLNANNDTNEGTMRGASALIGNARFVLTFEKCRIADKDNKNKKVFSKNYVRARITKANFTQIEERIYKRMEDGALHQLNSQYTEEDIDEFDKLKSKTTY